MKLRKQPRRLIKEITVTDELGIHASVAGKIMSIVQKAYGNISIAHKGENADAASMLDILSLECGKGSRISIIAEDARDHVIIEAIEELVKNGFGETT